MKIDIPPRNDYYHDVQTLKEHTAELIQRQDETNAIIEEALKKSAKLLSGGDKTVYVLPVNPDLPMKGMGGVAAWTLDEDVILLLLGSLLYERKARVYHGA